MSHFTTFARTVCSVFLFILIISPPSLNADGPVGHIIIFPDLSYIPDQLDVMVGDTIIWQGNFAMHPLESTSVPDGAEPFANSTGSEYRYVVEVAGHYTYHCVAHQPAMSGEFTAYEDLPLPDQVVLIYPGNGETVEVQAGEPEVELRWYQAEPEVTVYNLDIATDVDFDDIVFTSDVLSDTLYGFTDVQDDQTYYWRVRAENATGWGEYSEVWSFTASIVVGVDNTETPYTFNLMQNYPNPFNPTTEIRFTLPERTHVTLEVFAVHGQHITTIVNESRDAGIHTVTFDATGLASGIYLYRLRADQSVRTKRMVYIR